ncbi:MAG: ArnT family glycosyltransferase [Planctomycetota bacterium]
MSTSPARSIRVSMMLVIVATSLLISLPEITTSGPCSPDGQRYAFNGVLIHDMLRDGQVLHPYQYNVDFYSRYPATNLPYGPPVLAAVFAAAFRLLGVSFVTARAVVSLYTVATAMMTRFLVERVTGRYWLSVLSVGLLLSNPIIGICARDIGPEMAVALHSFLTLWLFFEYVENDRRWFGLFAAFSLGLGYLSKQYIIPLGLALPLYAAIRGKWSLLKLRETWIAALVAVLLTVPYTILSLKFSNEDLGLKLAPPMSWDLLLGYPRLMFRFIPVLLVMGLTGCVIGLRRRQPIVMLTSLWALTWYGFNTFSMGYVIHERYLFSFVLALLVPAAIAVDEILLLLRRPSLQPVGIAAILMWMGVEASQTPRYFVRGYEDAGRFVAGLPEPGQSILFYGTYDGSFMMGVRERRPTGGPLILRGERHLAVRLWFDDVPKEIRVHTPEDIVKMMNQHQTGYVVVERDLPGTKNNYPEYRLLLETAATHRQFEELQRFPIEDECWCGAGSELIVYRFHPETAPAKTETKFPEKITRLEIEVPTLPATPDIALETR